MKSKICRVLGHKWKYNFSTQPSRAICKRCKSKARFDVFKLEWNKVENFDNEIRTDTQLINDWTYSVKY